MATISFWWRYEAIYRRVICQQKKSSCHTRCELEKLGIIIIIPFPIWHFSFNSFLICPNIGKSRKLINDFENNSSKLLHSFQESFFSDYNLTFSLLTNQKHEKCTGKIISTFHETSILVQECRISDTLFFRLYMKTRILGPGAPSRKKYSCSKIMIKESYLCRSMKYFLTQIEAPVGAVSNTQLRIQWVNHVLIDHDFQ